MKKNLSTTVDSLSFEDTTKKMYLLSTQQDKSNQ